MADNTLLAVLGIVLITLVSAVFFATQTGTTSNDNIAGEALTPPTTNNPDVCDAGRYCEGSKLVIVRNDCSLGTAYCQHGCDRKNLVCY